ncbi:MAG: alpha/beta fold hydrolase [Bacteroidota bacterium]
MVSSTYATSGQKGTIYLFPGQGSDERVFQKLQFPDGYKVICMEYPIPEKSQSLKSFANTFIQEIDTSLPYTLIGYSLGGMVCTELTDILNPEKTIIISSAKCRHELPGRYTFQKYVPINRILPKQMIKLGALALQPIVEPDRNKEKEIFKAMLKAKEPVYLKRTSNMIINWSRNKSPENIIHIHGNKDHTIPVRNVKHDYLIEGGSHMMVLTRSAIINEVLQELL